jgi:hypothetical protein
MTAAPIFGLYAHVPLSVRLAVVVTVAFVTVGKTDGEIVIMGQVGFEDGTDDNDTFGSGVGNLVGVFVPAVGFGA